MLLKNNNCTKIICQMHTVSLHTLYEFMLLLMLEDVSNFTVLWNVAFLIFSVKVKLLRIHKWF